MKITQERIDAFLKDYEQLCRQYALVLDTCQNCEEQWLRDVDDQAVRDHVQDIGGILQTSRHHTDVYD